MIGIVTYGPFIMAAITETLIFLENFYNPYETFYFFSHINYNNKGISLSLSFFYAIN